ncbi:hypothetical protein FF38_06778 [Lucilia cuprina]|uniref:MADF domain-containing protein n=1 Tax=Lucilia cuprina TaxID=7375 RepID=A0A0L0CP06_LUCCU|nr:hypothetical protein CVS40_10587 [Lucilia cuprina]KNC33189.1 hypothetical protein FF38_06778 [Lucilia cuprina]
MTMEWTREKTLALIQEYRKRRGLWDMTHEDYRKKDVKQKLLVEVSETLGGNIPIMEIEKKFHTLRTQYHREINRMKRKEPYNSKWFGFKYLQFLSSPKACRSNKGRIKAEITEEGTVTTKYIIREAIQPGHDTSMGSGNENEEFLTLPRRTTAISYEAVPASTATSTASSRSHELEKLIEETTKDVEEIEDAKPKMTIKEISVPMDHHQQHHADSYSGGGELQISNVESEHQELHHIEDVEGNMESMGMQHQMTSDEELNYQTTTSNHGVSSAVSTVNAGHTQSSTTTVHTIPARIIKIQRRDTHHDNNDYYEQQQHHHHHHQHMQQQHQHQQHHIQTISPPGGGGGSGGSTTTKRIYYDPSTHHTTTILTASPSQQQTGVSLINASSSPSINTSPTNSKVHLRNSLAAAAASSGINSSNNPLNNSALNPSTTVTSALRDEFTTYGEYVANEMREIKSREILLTLKHKINTALFEANMQELQK